MRTLEIGEGGDISAWSLATEVGYTFADAALEAARIALTYRTPVFLLSDASALFLGQTLNPNAGGYMP